MPMHLDNLSFSLKSPPAGACRLSLMQGWMHYCLAFCATDSCFDLGLNNSTVSFPGWVRGSCCGCHIEKIDEAAVHHFAWLDATGRLFGLCEVLLSYIYGRWF